MRVYLLVSVILSLILPLIIIPINWRSSLSDSDLYNNYRLIFGNQLNSFSSSQSINSGTVKQQLLPILILGFYVIGLLYKSFNFVRNLRSIRTCIKQNPKEKDGKYWLVNLTTTMPPFSFFNYIFISNSCQNLSPDELQRIKDHEKIHARELHSLDVLLIELISILYWFNPLLIYLKKSIQEIHEYIVDEKIIGIGKRKKDYAELLLKLASEVKSFNLSAGFSGSQIKRRIVMISKQRSLPGQKLMLPY
jgi:beta-lactamase regulating signal transducer with metallopeptidase domain